VSWGGGGGGGGGVRPHTLWCGSEVAVLSLSVKGCPKHLSQ